MKKICVAGLNPSWQKTLHFNHFERGGINRAFQLDRTPSGKGINFARAAAVWGLAETTVYQFLAGDSGKKIRQGMWQERLSHVSVETPGETRNCTTLLSEDDSVMTELVEPAPEVPPMEAASLFQSFLAGLEKADAAAICGTYPPGINEFFYTRIALKTMELGKFLFVDSCCHIEPVLQNGADFLKINRDELAGLTGEADTPRAIAKAFSLFKLHWIGITDGPDRAWLSDGTALSQITVPELEHVVNPIGSGDTCSSVTLSEILCGTEPLEAFRRGLAAASANCLSAEPAAFTREDAMKLLPGFTVEQQSFLVM